MSIELCTICLEPLIKNGDDNSNTDSNTDSNRNSNRDGNIDCNGKNDIDIDLFFCSRCNNKFHKKCIFQIIIFNRSEGKTSHCPLCREEIFLFSMILFPPGSSQTQDEILYRDSHTHIANERTPLILTRCRHISCRFLLCCSGRCLYN